MFNQLIRRVWKYLYLIVLLFSPFCLAAQVTADFTVDTLQGCTPLSVSFINKSTGTGLSYSWRFGNGNTSIQKDPKAIYFRPGMYDVTLIVKSSSGQIDSVTKKNYLEVFKNPDAGFKANIFTGCKPLLINFSDTSITGSGIITSYTWDFGDGRLSRVKNPNHIYDSSGNFNVSLIVKDTNNCQDFVFSNNYIFVKATPDLKFSAVPTNGCAVPANVAFTSKIRSGTALNPVYSWTFGDGSTSSGASPSHSYTNFGSYDVNLKVTGANGCSSTLTKKKYITFSRATAGFSATPVSGCIPHEVSFLNSTKDAPADATYKWFFGDGSTSTAANPTHTYSTSGNFDVKLIVSYSSGKCGDTLVKKQYITTKNTSSVDFSASPLSSCSAPLKVSFSPSSTSGTSYKWYFGDGDSSTSTSPDHNYTGKGIYSVTLVQKNSDGCIVTIKKDSLVKIFPPQASIGVDLEKGCVPLEVTFSDSSIVAGTVTSRSWDFGNGNTSTSPNPKTTYNDTGLFSVRLIIKTADGCTDTTFREIQVGNKPSASFTGDPRKGCNGDLVVTFENLTPDPDSILQFKWLFGEGGSSEERNPAHDFDAPPGKYDVTLIANHNGCRDTADSIDFVEVLGPQARFNQSLLKCAVDTAEFIDFSLEATSIKWIFPDSSTSTDSIEKKVLLPGIHRITLVAYNSNTGCIDTTFSNIFVPDSVTFGFTVKPDSGCAPLNVKFTGNSNMPNIQYKWDFGEGGNPLPTFGKIPSNIYETPGNYDVTLEITTSTSCVKTLTKKDAVKVKGPDVNLTVMADTGCIPFTALFIDSSTSTHKVVKKEWAFEGKSFRDSFVTQYGYDFTEPPVDQKAGTKVYLRLTDTLGCMAMDSIVVYPLAPVPAYKVSTGNLCDSALFTFLPSMEDSNGLAPLDYSWILEGVPTDKDTLRKIFTDTGIYDLSVTVSDIKGCKTTIDTFVRIDGFKPNAGFRAFPLNSACPPLEVTFEDTSKAGLSRITKTFWSFGDGTSSSFENPQKVFLQAGSFDVRLYVTDSSGCTDSVIKKDLVQVSGAGGDYIITPVEGCSPLKVKFQANTIAADKIKWDMGDGTILEGEDVTYQYNLPGRYIPLLILTDSSGCTYTLPPTDTVRVRPHPTAGFSVSGKCLNENVIFSDTSFTTQGTLTYRKWEIMADTPSTKTVTYRFSSGGEKFIRLIVKNSFGCPDTASKKIFIGDVTASFIAGAENACLGMEFPVTDQSSSDTSIASYKWIIPGKDTFSGNDPKIFFPSTGIFSLMQVVTDSRGCRDTFMLDGIKTGDSSRPTPVSIRRVTVNEDNSVTLEFYRSDTFGFFKYHIFRALRNGTFKQNGEITKINDTIFIDQNASPYLESYCYKVTVQNICGIETSLEKAEEHCTIELSTKEDTNEVFLEWTPYIGFDSILRYEVYRDINNGAELIATVPGKQNTYLDTNTVCYRDHLYRVKAINANFPDIVSFSDTSLALPDYIPKLEKPELIRATVNNDDFVRVEWNPIAGARAYFLQRKTGNNSSSSVITVDKDSTSLSDLPTRVDEDFYSYRLKYSDSCGDISINSNIARSILLQVDTNARKRPVLTWNKYKKWAEGVKEYIIELRDETNTFVEITRVGPEDTQYVDKITGLNRLKNYCYRVTAVKENSSLISQSNIDCAPVKSSLYIPNAFTPNEDGINDLFDVVGTYISDYEILIFNRWGQRIFESSFITVPWDGKYKNEYVEDGVYLFIISATGADSKKYLVKGEVVLIK